MNKTKTPGIFEKNDKMKKSKTVSKSKKKPQSNTQEPKKKKIKTIPRSKEKAKTLRKSRWEEVSNISANEDSKKAKFPDPILAVKKEKVEENFSQIEDFLNEKEKLVELLFLAITGTALEEIIPDYLKKRPLEELKKLCLEELNKMSSDVILNVISGKLNPLFTEKETQTEEPAIHPETSSCDSTVKDSDEVCKSLENDLETSESDVLELYAASTDMSCDVDEENQAPAEVLEEVAKDLGVSGSDAELLELEMRARAIRSLLKLKTNDEPDPDIVP